MNWINVIYYVLTMLIGSLVTCVPFIMKLHKVVKEKAKALTINDLLAMAQNFVETAEKTFAGFDITMKAQGSSAGAMKKDTVFNKLQAYALQNGYEFDAEYWDAKIDEIVAFTREVNVKKTK